MKTIRIAIWINILFYAVNLGFSAWLLSKIVVVAGPRLPEISDFIKFGIILIALVHSLPVICIVGLLRRKNWGRILTIFTNIFLSIGYISGRIIGAMGLGANIIQTLTAHDVLVAYSISIPLIALTVVLFTRKAKSYFVRV